MVFFRQRKAAIRRLVFMAGLRSSHQQPRQ
ncbi:hypothetical protein mEp044_20 [Escherichia phage mEp044]